MKARPRQCWNVALLPKGIKKRDGQFLAGEVIEICNLQGRDIAHGVSRYNSDAFAADSRSPLSQQIVRFWAMNMARSLFIVMT